MSPSVGLDPRHRWRAHVAATSTKPALTVGIAASFTVNPIEPYVGAALLDAGVTNPRLQIADYNQLHQACLDPDSVFGGVPQRLVLLWRLEDVFEADVSQLLDGHSAAAGRLLDGVAELITLMAQCTSTHRVPIVIGIPPFPRIVGSDPLDVPTTSLLGAVHSKAVNQVEEALGNADGIRLVDHRRLVDELGAGNVHDDRGMLLYRQPYRTALLKSLGSLSGAAVRSFDTVPPKLIVLDLDDTIWGGVVGDEGAEGLAIGDTFPGNAFVAFQRELRRLSNRGVLLAVCSKNDADNVQEVFATRREMVLATDDFVAWRVNWDPKSDNIAAIADELNLGLDSVVFIDDSDFELAQVGGALPAVRTVKVPEDPADLPQLIASTGWFRSLHASAEDRQRTAMMHEEGQRNLARTEISPESFLASLQLRVKFFRVGDSNVGRVAQLVNKTNQFNLTTRRRTEAEVGALAVSDDHAVHAIEVVDRFGSYGLVGAAVSARQPDGSWFIDTLLMSCRVLRRGVETAFLAALIDDLRGGSRLAVTGAYIPSSKNSQVADFYPDHGFASVGDGKFVLAAGDGVAVPPHIELVTDA